ncbi:MAG: hypothetical protein IJ945_03590 [Oscillospiraceae bacterium]|nr:hypothetical protein [Oscillospiraceae bacterium]
MHRNHHREPQSPVAALLVGIFGICFGIFWTLMAASMAPFMALFGILFIAVAVVNTVNIYKTIKENQKNGSSAENPVYYQNPEHSEPEELRCPYCGAPIKRGERKCEYCGSEF